MIPDRRSRVFSFLLALAAFTATNACSASTPHLTDVGVFSDKALSKPSTAFAKQDAIYAQCSAANAGGKVSVVWHLISEKVDGQPPNAANPSLDKSFDLDGDATTDYTLTPSGSGWPAGTYRLEVDLLIDGQQKDQKTAEITVS